MPSCETSGDEAAELDPATKDGSFGVLCDGGTFPLWMTIDDDPGVPPSAGLAAYSSSFDLFRLPARPGLWHEIRVARRVRAEPASS